MGVAQAVHPDRAATAREDNRAGLSMDAVDHRRSLDGQRPQWERALYERPDRFGTQASEPARATVQLLRRERLTHVLELGPAQGRDTLFLAEQGFEVHALDYATSAVATIKHKARDAGLSAKVTATTHDLREPLPYPDQSFDCCYSHMLFAWRSRWPNSASSRARSCVLRPGGLCIYTARSTRDPDFGSVPRRAPQANAGMSPRTLHGKHGREPAVCSSCALAGPGPLGAGGHRGGCRFRRHARS